MNIRVNDTNPLYQLDIAIGICRNDADDGDINVGAPLTVDITDSGANGLDTGSEASNTWYFVWVIYDPINQVEAGLLSESSTSPTLPSGYTRKRLIGTIKNNASSSFMETWQYGSGRHRKYIYIDSKKHLDNGTATSYADLDCSKYISPISNLGIFNLEGESSTSSDKKAKIRPNGTSVDYTHRLSFYKYGSSSVHCPTDDNQVIEYYVDSDSQADIFIVGYEEDL